MYIWIYNTLNADQHIAIQMGRIPGGPWQVVANAAGGDGCPARAAVRSRFAFARFVSYGGRGSGALGRSAPSGQAQLDAIGD